MSMGGGGGGGGNTTTRQEIDPWMKNQLQRNLGHIDHLIAQGFHPYQGQGVLPLNQESLGMIGGILGVAQNNPLSPQLYEAMDGFRNTMEWGQNPDLSMMQPYERRQFERPQFDVQNWVEARPEFMADHVNNYQSLAQQTGYTPENVNLSELDLAQFMNPYTQDVVNAAMGDLDRARAQAVNRTQDQSIAAGAFAGSRAALADAATNREYADAQANAAAQLRHQGFNTALGAAQNQQGMDLQAQLANQGAGLQARQLNNADRLNTHALNQQGYFQTAGLNQAGQLASEQINQQAQQWAQNTNLQAELAQQQINEQGNLAAAQLNEQSNLAAHSLNQQGLMDYQNQLLDAQRLGLLGAQGLQGGAMAANQMLMGNLGMGLDAASMLQNNQQAQENFNYQEYLRRQEWPERMLQMRTSALHGMPMLGSTTSQNVPGGSTLGNAIGGAFSGGAMGGMMAGMSGGAIGGPMGMAIGAGLGLLGGMFG